MRATKPLYGVIKHLFQFFLISFSLVLNCQAQTKVNAHDFKGIYLGITKQRFLETAFPASEKYFPAHFVACSDDDAYRLESIGYLTSIEKDLNVVACQYASMQKTYSSSSPHYEKARLAVGSQGYHAAYHDFKFMKLSSDSEPKLYSIYFSFYIGTIDSVKDGLMEKFGKPRIMVGQVKNKLGGVFSNTTYVWENSLSKVTLEERGEDIEHSSLQYQLKGYFDYLSKAKKEKSKNSM